MAIFRVYVEKKPVYAEESARLLRDLRTLLGLTGITGLRLLNRYDVEGIDPAVYEKAKHIVFSEPQVDVVWDECFPEPRNLHSLLAVEALPGQFDQRADSCAQCVQLMAGVERPLVRHAKVYMLEGRLTGEELARIKSYLINPVESREASMDKPATLTRSHDTPPMVETLAGFTALDGATRTQQFFSITLPLLSPTTLFLLVTTFLSSMKVFQSVDILTSGGPSRSTEVFVYLIYRYAMVDFRMDRAATSAVMFFLILLGITVATMKYSNNTVNYDS